MYIGPWQEYRLAKIQDDAIQRLRQEWEATLSGQLAPGDDDRIRELMQPLVAKLPSMLLAAKSRTSGSSTGSRNGRLTRSNSSVSSEASTRYSSRPESARSKNNQETHDPSSSRAPFKPPRPKKGKKLTALEQVQKRKKMFATWIKEAGNNDATGQAAPEAEPQTKKVDKASVGLPPIHSAAPASAATLLGDSSSSKASLPLKLPPLSTLSISTDEVPEEDPSNQAPIVSPTISAPSNAADIDLDESVDEEELNKLLNWTDTLLSPHALDSLCDFDS
ncbi:hypothetical protein PInf_015600 [Phytophthora infestans]|nr:hypothetical protein PInf_015600 [Phytophthora infestans]